MKANAPAFDTGVVRSKVRGGRTISRDRKNGLVYSHGETTDAIFNIQISSRCQFFPIVAVKRGCPWSESTYSVARVP